MSKPLIYAILYSSLTFMCLRVTYARLLRIVIVAVAVSMVLIVFALRWSSDAMGIADGLLAVFVVATLLARRGEIRRWRDDPANAGIVLEPPGAGIWVVAIGGPFARPNPHTSVPAQRFAYDFVRADDRSFGTPIVSPIEGFVEHVRDTMHDDDFTQWGSDSQHVPFIYGNLESIRQGTVRVLLCHLQQNSIVVKVGDCVHAGSPLGRCGDSGRSFEPHLHVHAQDKPANQNGDGVPIAFNIDGCVRAPLPGEKLSNSALHTHLRN